MGHIGEATSSMVDTGGVSGCILRVGPFVGRAGAIVYRGCAWWRGPAWQVLIARVFGCFRVGLSHRAVWGLRDVGGLGSHGRGCSGSAGLWRMCM